MAVAVIGVIAVFFLGMGIFALAAPAALVRPFGITLGESASRAEVRAVFRLPKNEQAAGLMVTEGKVLRNSRVRLLRNGAVIYDGTISALKRFKDDVREVAQGYECGISLEGFNDFQQDDTLEFYRKEQVAAK